MPFRRTDAASRTPVIVIVKVTGFVRWEFGSVARTSLTGRPGACCEGLRRLNLLLLFLFFRFFSFLCCLLPPLLRFLFLRHLCFCFLILVLHLRHYCLLLFLPSSSSSSSSPTSSFFFSLPLFPPLSDNLSLSGILRSPPPPPQAQRLVPHATTRILLASYTPSSLYDRSGHDVRVPPASSPTDAPNAFTVSPPTDRPPSHPFPFRQQVGFASTEDPDLSGSRVRRVFGLSLDAATGSREDCVHLKVFITLVKRVI